MNNMKVTNRPANGGGSLTQEGRKTGLLLSNVSIKYYVVSDHMRTLKGRIMGTRSGLHANEFWAVRDISFEARQGEVLALVGENGAGKSTLLRAIGGIIAPTKGQIDVFGSVSPLLELGGAFNFELTGRENTRLYGSLLRKSRDEIEQMIPEVIAFSELGVFFDAPIKTYSSGMLARLAFSVGTQLKPDILLLDEVLAVGDERFQQKSFFRVKKLIGSGSLVLLVSHSSAMVEAMATRAILLEDGRIVGDGKPSEIIAQYRKQVERK